MDPVKVSQPTPRKSKIARTFAKVLKIRGLTEISPLEKVSSQEKVVKFDLKDVNLSQSLNKLDDDFEKRKTFEAILAKLFASVSSFKASYAQLQHAQSPYDADGIQVADGLVIQELKTLSEMKQSFLKKQFDPFPEKTLILADIQEQRSLLKTYEIMGKKLESQARLKDSEIIFLREKLEEANKQNRAMEKKLNQSGPIFVVEDFKLSGLNTNHFASVLRHAVKSIRNFTRLMVEEMKLANWDIDVAVNSIEPGVIYYKEDHKCFAFEHFFCREMFDDFHPSSVSLQSEEKRFFERFTQLKSVKAKEYLSRNPKSTFAKYVRTKYLQMVHPKMETSFFGNLHQRNLVTSGEFPTTEFFVLFAEMAKRIWLVYCLAFSFEPKASIFQVPKGSRFSEVYMETVTDEAFLTVDPRVAFTVVPGFKIGQTIIQCQVFLSQRQTNVSR